MTSKRTSGARMSALMNANTVRFEHLVHIDTMLVHDDFAEPVRTLLQAHFPAVRDAMIAGGIESPAIAAATGVADLEACFAELAMEVDLGYLARAQQPCFVVVNRETLHYGWEHSHRCWFYARSYRALLARVKEWAAAHKKAAWARARAHPDCGRD